MFGVDQTPFDDGQGQHDFCLGYPLMVEQTGERLDADSFISRGRLWWLVDGIPEEELLPGSLHVAEIETAPKWQEGQTDKDRFQVRRLGRESSSKLWVEVVDVPGEVPDFDELSYRGVPVERRPWRRVFLRFDGEVVGPLFGLWNKGSKRLFAKRIGPNEESTNRFPRAALEQSGRVETLEWVTGQYRRPHPDPAPARRELLRAAEVGAVTEGAAGYDVVPLESIAQGYAYRLRLKYPGVEDAGERVALLDTLAADAPEPERERVQRLKRAIHDLETNSGLGPDLPPTVRTALQPFLVPADPAPAPAVVPSSAPSAPAAPPEATVPASAESEFVERFIDRVERSGYRFTERDLLAFHLGLKASRLVVLAGRSGVGKSSLPRLYARALGGIERLTTVAVRPDWLDDRDVLGAVDQLTRRYVPAPANIVQTLIDENAALRAGAGRPRLLLLDEMNLARVEYYFSSFLSALEQPSGARHLPLFAEAAVDGKDPLRAYARLEIPDNLRIVGTVNIDETTQTLSPKVLDRSCVQIFGKQNLSDAVGMIDETAGGEAPTVDWATWSAWIGDRDELQPWVSQKLIEVDAELRPIRSELGYRTFQRCLDFVAGARGLESWIDSKQALDIAITELVVPRLRTDSIDFADTVDKLLQVLPEGEFEQSHQLLVELREGGGGDTFWQLV